MQLELTTLHVNNLEKSLAFYQDILGMEEIKRLNPRTGVDIIFLEGEAGGIVELIADENQPTTDNPQSLVSLGFTVKDLTATIDELEAKGVKLAQGPIETLNGTKLAFIEDPNGVEIEFIENLSL